MAKSKTGNKRTATQRRLDIATIILLLRRCQNHEEVTAQLNKANKGKYSLTRQQVSLDIAEAINELVERNTANTIHARIVAAERMLEVANTAWVEYNRSIKLDQIKRITESAKAANEDGKIKTGKTRTETTSRLGDPRYLAIIKDALSEHARLLGLYVQPIKPGDELPLPGNTVKQFNINVTVSEGKKRALDPDDIPRAKVREITDDRSASAAGEAEKTKPADHGGIVIRTSPSAT